MKVKLKCFTISAVVYGPLFIQFTRPPREEPRRGVREGEGAGEGEGRAGSVNLGLEKKHRWVGRSDAGEKKLEDGWNCMARGDEMSLPPGFVKLFVLHVGSKGVVCEG